MWSIIDSNVMWHMTVEEKSKNFSSPDIFLVLLKFIFSLIFHPFSSLPRQSDKYLIYLRI
jgi:hypothetical protein